MLAVYRFLAIYAIDKFFGWAIARAQPWKLDCARGNCYRQGVTTDFLASFLNGGKEKERGLLGSKIGDEAEIVVSALPSFSLSAFAFKLESVLQGFSTVRTTVVHLPVAGSR
ncbi:hypothetical protein IQ270_14700 [Microcoleus sp. LEGE 07076]|uniref:hypothetical protein n=1 Tax=Microcoleus sp. LEGE 07076 TaxID=915322 RepID=UPI001880DFA1|nr:hypothetical protein [Microcoleus sp. LEGE 07076]MBE9185904.1 hypothetical protein [Microcoleus sp. LEGE 07076]